MVSLFLIPFFLSHVQHAKKRGNGVAQFVFLRVINEKTISFFFLYICTLFFFFYIVLLIQLLSFSCLLLLACA